MGCAAGTSSAPAAEPEPSPAEPSVAAAPAKSEAPVEPSVAAAPAKSEASSPPKKKTSEAASIETWEAFPHLKAGFDAYADAYGYVQLDNMEALRGLSKFLGLETATVREEMSKADLDANGFIGFAEFALWADKNTVGVPLGLDGVPDKRKWQKGMPRSWTSIPPLEENPSEGLPAATTAGFESVPEDPDTSELEDMLVAAKRYDWKSVCQILDRHPGYIDMRPPYRCYATIHQAANQGKVEIVKMLVEERKANPGLQNKIGQNPEQVASKAGKHSAAEYFAEACLRITEGGSCASAPARGGRGGAPSKAVLFSIANEAIDHAKWGRFGPLFELLEEQTEEIVNIRPPYREYGIIHQVAFRGNADIIKRLVDDFGADVLLKTKSGQTAYDIALKKQKQEASEYLASVAPSEEAAAQAEKEQLAHKVITAAKNADWAEMFKILDGDHTLVNFRPEVRQWGAIHQAAYHANAAVLQRMVEQYGADVSMMTKTGKTALQILEEKETNAVGKEDAIVYLQSASPTLSLVDEFVTYSEQQLVKVEDSHLFARLQTLLDRTHKSSDNWTRDRMKACGFMDKATPVPTGYDLVAVYRNENPPLWRRYSVYRAAIKDNHGSSLTPIRRWTPLTMEGPHLNWSDSDFNPDVNEWYLLHGTIPAGCSGISKGGFSMTNLGMGATGDSASKLGLYGNGTYFADCITKVDEYARVKVESGALAGCRCALVVRVVGGRHYYTDQEVAEADKPEFARRVLQGHFHSTVGDRLKLKNTFREYVAYDASGTYPEYVLYYKRKGVDAKYA